jgi:organic radical activating enzyme
MTLKISEIFESVQGEGVNIGKPSVFLRTALCNLTCNWCDTKYTWDWKNYDYATEVKEMSIHDIKDQIEKSNKNHLVITGGEPLLQQDGLSKLLDELDSGYFVEVETNGTIIPNNKLQDRVSQWNVSPKLSTSGNRFGTYEKDSCYRFFASLKNSYFKYVVKNENELQEVESLIDKYNIQRSRVLLMPQATNKEELYSRGPLIKTLSSKHGLLYTTRLHIEKWDNQRGR